MTSARPRCGARSAGVRWVPAEHFDELSRRRGFDPQALDPYPFESMETLNDPAAHRAFLARIGAGCTEEKTP